MRSGMLTRESFLVDVASHTMEVQLDQGVYRHLRFAAPGTSMRHFNILTWPGYLCICGDMGTYVFSRLQDMFEFFRTDEGRTINTDYWAEKVQAKDCNGSIEEYSPEKAEQVIREIMEESDAMTDAIRAAIEEEVLSRTGTPDDLYRAVGEFEHDGFQFYDFPYYDPQEYTYTFLWCCYAIAWSIQQYDKSKEAPQCPTSS